MAKLIKTICYSLLTVFFIGIGVLLYLIYPVYLEFNDLTTSNKYEPVELINEPIFSVDLNINYNHVDNMITEAKRLFNYPNNKGLYESNLPELTIISIPTKLPEWNHTTTIQKAEIILHCQSPLSLYNFLIGKEGFSVIDPVTPPSEHDVPPFYTFKRNNQITEIRQAIVPLPNPFKKRKFIVANTMDNEQLLFTSKSIKFEKDFFKSCTVEDLNSCRIEYEDVLTKNDDYIIVHNSFGFTVRQQDNTKCSLILYNLIHNMFDFLLIEHFMDAKGFFQGFNQRLLQNKEKF